VIYTGNSFKNSLHGTKDEYNERRGYKLGPSRSGEYEVGRNTTDMHERRNGADIRDQKWGSEKLARSGEINSGKKACYICG